MTPRQSHLEHMRGLLRVQGIVLDEPTEASSTAISSPTATVEAVDRDEVLRILVEAGAPSRDLEWLTDSCISVEHARGYRAPARQAWCFACDRVTECDADGCIDCRGAR